MALDRKKVEGALDIIGSVFGDIKDACTDGYYEIGANRLDDMDETLRCIQMYVILKNIRNLTGRKLEVLSYYLKYGYSKRTKDQIIKGLNIKDSNLNNINHQLRKMKVIENVGYNQSNNKVSSELLNFKEFIVDQKKQYILLKIG